MNDELRAALLALAEARRELAQVESQRATLFSAVSHRLRTPLSAILGSAELLLSRAPADAASREGLETIARNARAQARLLDELLRPSLLVAGAQVAPVISPPPVVPSAALHAMEGSLAGVKVLVIDDDDDARAVLALVLAATGAQVISAASSQEALAVLAAERPDILVSDIGMPERDGYQLMRSIRHLPVERGGRTPAVALTGFARSEDRTRALLAGYQVHLTKPIEPHELVATLVSLTGLA